MGQIPDEPFEIQVAAFASWLPQCAPPFGDNDFDVPYRDRLKSTHLVGPDTSLAEVYDLASEAMMPRTIGPPGYEGGDGRDAIYWVWFYEEQDSEGIGQKHYELPEDLVLVDDRGLAVWRLASAEITMAHLLRAGNAGLLHGDPRRPYLVVLLPQADGGLPTVWETFLALWGAWSSFLTLRETANLSRRAMDRLRARSGGVEVIRQHVDHLAAQNAGPGDLIKLVRARPWPLEDIRMLLGLDSNAHAEAVLMLAGLAPNAAGDYEVDGDDEARILRLATDAILLHSMPWQTESPEAIHADLKHILERGEPKPYEMPPCDDEPER